MREICMSGLMGADAAPILPAASPAMVLMAWTPAESVEVVMIHVPVAAVTPVPTAVVPS
jgi:hypothetical protein